MSSDYLSCTLRSFSAAPLQTVARAVAQRWGDDPVLAPDRAGFSERTKLLKKSSLVDRLDEAWSAGRESDDLWLYVERPELDLVGDLRYFTELGPTQDHQVSFSLGLEFANDLDAIVELAADLFVAVDGYFGSIDTVSMGEHQFQLARSGGALGVVPRIDAGDDTTFRFEHVVDGPWWVNFYGPAFVERWDADLLDRLGNSRRRLSNGGVMVKTSDGPIPADRSVTTLLGHPHQRRLVEQLGADMFLHETGSNDFPEAGLAVPSRLDHVRAGQRTHPTHRRHDRDGPAPRSPG